MAMNDQLSRDLASLSIDRTISPRRGRLMAMMLGVVLSVAVAGVGYLYVVPWVEAKLFKTEVTLTEISLVSPAHANILLTSTGYVVPQLTSKVGAKIAGRVLEVHVKEGSRVKAGDLLVKLDPADLERNLATSKMRLLAAKARVQTARANLAEIKLQADRERKLADKQFAPLATAQDLEAKAESLAQQLKAADAEVKVSEAELSTQQTNLGNTVIVAPIDGVVTTKPIEVGAFVGTMGGTTLVELADFSSLMVETDVPEGKLHLVKPQGPAEIVLDAFPERRFRGRVKDTSPKVNRSKATVIVRVQFVGEPEHVIPDMSARVSFLSAEIDEQAMKQPPKLVVPAAAVAQRSGQDVVFVMQEGKLRVVPIVIGPEFANGYQLQRGPDAGTRVVKEPAPELTDGQAVKEKTEP